MSDLKANTKGALFMMGSMAAFTINDAFMKALGLVLPLPQAVVLRGLLTVAFLVALAPYLGGVKLRLPRRDWALITARNVAEVLIAYLFITAIFNMPFANATAILQVIPLAITLAGWLFLKEQVGWRRLSAIIVGFIGVLLIVRPGFEGFNIYSVYVLVAVIMVTFRDLLVRRMSPDVPTMTVAISNAVSVTVVFGIWATQVDWAPVGIAEMSKLCAAAVMVALAYFCAVATMRSGDLAFIAPLRYTALLWALAIGFFVFGEWPDSVALVGALVVVVTGIYSFYRERRIALQSKAETVSPGTVDKY